MPVQNSDSKQNSKIWTMRWWKARDMAQIAGGQVKNGVIAIPSRNSETKKSVKSFWMEYKSSPSPPWRWQHQSLHLHQKRRILLFTARSFHLLASSIRVSGGRARKLHALKQHVPPRVHWDIRTYRITKKNERYLLRHISHYPVRFSFLSAR